MRRALRFLPCWPPKWTTSSTTRVDHRRMAPQSRRLALSAMASNTGCTSVGRAGDHLQNVGGGRLPLQRLLGFVEQPHVFDRDYGLVGKSPQQADLLVAKGVYLGPAEYDRADGLALAKQWYAENRSAPVDDRHAPCHCKFGGLLREHIMQVHRPPVGYRPPRRGGAIVGPAPPCERNRAVMGLGLQLFSIFQYDDGVVGLAQLAGALHDRLQHGLHVGRRGGDHIEDVGAAGLVG